MHTLPNDIIVHPTAADRIKEEVGQTLSPFNKWVTGEKMHHDPTPDECFEHWRKNRGRKNFRQTHTVAA